MTTNAKCKDAAPIKWPTDASHYQLIGVIGSVERTMRRYPIGRICRCLQSALQGQ